MDSVNFATSAAGPDANRPLRETGEDFFIFIGGKLWGQGREKSRRKEEMTYRHLFLQLPERFISSQAPVIWRR